MSLLRPRVRDDRGTPVSPRTPGDYLAWERAGLSDDVFLLWRIGPGCVTSLVLAVEIAAGVLAFRLGAGVIARQRMLDPVLLIVAIALALVVTASAAWFLLGRHVEAAIVRRSVLPAFRAARLCVHCRVKLHGAREPDGCTLCPECGAAWRLGEEGTKARSHEGTEGADSARP